MKGPFCYPDNFLRLLGTGGARFTMLKQIRKTGGIWFTYGGLNGVIDPGPGSLYHMCSSVPALDPHELRAIILTHRHLDHSTDLNVAAEAMTGGGFEKQGLVLLPDDSAGGPNPVLLRYIAQKVGGVMIAEDAGELLQKLHPEKAVITHMGVIMIEAGPEKYAKMISTEKTKVIAGRDGMVIDLDTLKAYAEAAGAVSCDTFMPIEE